MGDLRQTAVSDLSKVIPWLVVPRLDHGTLWTRVKQRNHPAIAAESRSRGEKREFRSRKKYKRGPSFASLSYFKMFK
jgi:hypothetical protein